MSWPQFSLRIFKQGKPQGPYDNRYQIADLEEDDIAAINAGKAEMVEVRLYRKDNADALPQEVDALFNRVGPPTVIGTYSHPEQITDPYIRRDATDMWAVNFVSADDIVRWRGREYRVLELEDIDRECGPVGYYTGYAMCQRTDNPPNGRCNPKRLPVDKLRRVRRDAAATDQLMERKGA